MAAFPMFVELNHEPCLVVGGGSVAYRKVLSLLDFGADVTVVAKAVLPELEALAGVRIIKRAFAPSDVEGMRLVVAASSDADCNRSVAAECRQKRIPVNAADMPAQCDFYFPALVRRGDVVVGISTGGGSPALAGGIRKYVDSVLPESLGAQAKEAAALRKRLLAEGKKPAEDARYRRATAVGGSILK